MTVTPYKWTVDRYHQAVEAGIFDDQPVELLKGELVLMSPEGGPHANRSTQTRDYLIRFLGARAQVREGHPITLQNDSEPEPDIAVVQPLDEEYDKHHPYPENVFWLIEFSNSTLQKDLEIKSEIYATAEIVEYWVLNLKDKSLIVFRNPVDGKYQTEQTYRTETINPLAFPDVVISIDVLLGRDRWIPD